MTIETRYNVGDTAWVMVDEQAIEVAVIGVHTTCFIDENLKIFYNFDYTDFSAPPLIGLFEKDVYATKEELLKNL